MKPTPGWGWTLVLVTTLSHRSCAKGDGMELLAKWVTCPCRVICNLKFCALFPVNRLTYQNQLVDLFVNSC